MVDLQKEYDELSEEIRIGCIADHELPVTEFFKVFSSLAAENGDTPDMQYCPILKEGTGGYRADGHALDILEGDSEESGDLYLAICDFHQEVDLPVINAKDVDRSVDDVERFFRLATDQQFLRNLEETSPAFQLAILIQQYLKRIRRLRVILLTNAHLRTRRNVFATREIGPVTLHVNVLDIERYAKISHGGGDPVEIDFEEDFDGPIECLSASTGAHAYQSYLFAIPGHVLAGVFAAFGNRLLEQNVRTYLQARTSVNKGILKTIAEEPNMFLAYNNGITATASQISTKKLESGSLGITRIKDFQIVNGGQTTASLLYARDGQKKNLEHVYIQVKLTVVDEERLGAVIPKISAYANTQNKVSLSDLASNSPVQIKIERLSKEVTVPQRAGALHSSKWFYERATGQYRNLFAYKSQPERRKLELMYPKAQLVTKTDLAKYELSFDGRPHHVSEGAQKCFNRYTTSYLAKAGDGLSEVWYKRAIAKALLFIGLDQAILKSDWYKGEKGYKAQIVTYSIAACAQAFRESGVQIDLDRIWGDQSVPDALIDWMLKVSFRVAAILKSPPDGVKNVTEYAKKEFCWELNIKGKVGVPNASLMQYGISFEEFDHESHLGTVDDKRNIELDFEISLVKLIPRASEIIAEAKLRGSASPKNVSALEKLAAGKLSLNAGEKNALRALLERLEISY